MIGPKYERAAKPTRLQEATAYELVTLRDLNVCQRCLRNCGPIARDHRKNRSAGGRTAASNLQLLGLLCHQWKTEHPHEAVAEGWGVPGWPAAHPIEWPAARWVKSGTGTRRKAWVLYDDDGSIREISDDQARQRMHDMGWPL